MNTREQRLAKFQQSRANSLDKVIKSEEKVIESEHPPVLSETKEHKTTEKFDPKKLSLVEKVNYNGNKGLAGFDQIKNIYFSPSINQWYWSCENVNIIISNLNRRFINKPKAKFVERQQFKDFGLSLRSNNNYVFLMQKKTIAEAQGKFIKEPKDFFKFYGLVPSDDEINALKEIRTLSNNKDTAVLKSYKEVLRRYKDSFLGATDIKKNTESEQKKNSDNIKMIDKKPSPDEINFVNSSHSNKVAAMPLKMDLDAKKSSATETKALNYSNSSNSFETPASSLKRKLGDSNQLKENGSSVKRLKCTHSTMFLSTPIEFFRDLFLKDLKVDKKIWIFDPNIGYLRDFASDNLAYLNMKTFERQAVSCGWSIGFEQIGKYVLIQAMNENNELSTDPHMSEAVFETLRLCANPVIAEKMSLRGSNF